MPNLKDVKKFNNTLLKILFSLYNKIMGIFKSLLELNNKDDLVAQLVEHLPFKERSWVRTPARSHI